MNANISFEIRARAFYRMTGKLAPGKDEPAAVNWEDRGERLAVWAAWIRQYGPCIDAMLEAMAYVTGDDIEPPQPFIEP